MNPCQEVHLSTAKDQASGLWHVAEGRQHLLERQLDLTIRLRAVLREQRTLLALWLETGDDDVIDLARTVDDKLRLASRSLIHLGIAALANFEKTIAATSDHLKQQSGAEPHDAPEPREMGGR